MEPWRSGRCLARGRRREKEHKQLKEDPACVQVVRDRSFVMIVIYRSCNVAVANRWIEKSATHKITHVCLLRCKGCGLSIHEDLLNKYAEDMVKYCTMGLNNGIQDTLASKIDLRNKKEQEIVHEDMAVLTDEFKDYYDIASNMFASEADGYQFYNS